MKTFGSRRCAKHTKNAAIIIITDMEWRKERYKNVAYYVRAG